MCIPTGHITKHNAQVLSYSIRPSLDYTALATNPPSTGQSVRETQTAIRCFCRGVGREIPERGEIPIIDRTGGTQGTGLFSRAGHRTTTTRVTHLTHTRTKLLVFSSLFMCVSGIQPERTVLSLLSPAGLFSISPIGPRSKTNNFRMCAPDCQLSGDVRCFYQSKSTPTISTLVRVPRMLAQSNLI